VDYALVEQAMWEAAGRTEREAHRAILQSLDIDVPPVVIGKQGYTRVGRCEDKYHTMAGSVSVERSLYRKSGELQFNNSNSGGCDRGGKFELDWSQLAAFSPGRTLAAGLHIFPW
jgi:hypothetical protein